MSRKVKINKEKLNLLVDKFKDLTDREFEVAKLLNEEMSSKQIAAVLSISSHTVDCHRRNIINKLKIKDTRSLTFLKLD